MIAYHGSAEIKEKYLLRVTMHEQADEIIKGQYWANGKGCAVGCTIHSSSHQAYETELGIPIILARLEDGIFENLPNDLAKNWPRRFLESIRPGADLSNIWPQFAVWMLTDSKYGVLQFAKTDRTKESIQKISDMYSAQLNGSSPSKEEWRAAAAAAYAAHAADAAADAKSVEWRIAQSEKLIELLKGAK